MPTNATIAAAHQAVLTPNYGKLPAALVRGSGSRLWDADGKEYLDLFAGFGGTILGHCHPKLIEAITAQSNQLWATGNQFYSEPQVALAERIIKHAFPGLVFLCHSGAEAAEAALKLARLTAPAGRDKIIAFQNGFHGRTMGALTATPGPYQTGFGRLVPGFSYATYNDIASVEKLVDDQTAAIILEPIQGEGGMNVPTPEFMQAIRKLCTERQICMIVDEVWTGVGRTGKYFGYQHFGITPDIMTMGKALGGGVPVAGILAVQERAEKLVPGTHGCTLGGNPICAAVAAAVLKTLETDGLVERAATLSGTVKKAIGDFKSADRIKSIRGLGLMLGIELNLPDASALPAAALQRGIVVNVTRKNIVRLAPALTIPEDELLRGLAILDATIAAL